MKPDTIQARPYPTSFLDRLMDSVERLPIPYWLTYLLFFLLQSIIVHVLVWIEGWQPAFTFNPLVLLYPIWLWGPLAMMTYLDRVSIEALSNFSPLLDVGEEEINRLKVEFTTMPARNVIISGVIWVIVYLFLNYLAFDAFFVANRLGTFLTVFFIIEGLISYAIGSAIYYHSIRQLRLVNRTVKMVSQFNLFELDPVYAFSKVTSQIGVSWMIMLSWTLLLFPMQLASGPVLATLVLQIALAVAAFVLPLWLVHRRLVAEKRRLLADLNRRVEVTLNRLHHYVDQNDLAAVEQVNFAMTGLNDEKSILNAIPTWPWRAGTLTGFLSAIVLPILFIIIQLVVERLAW